MEIVVNHMTRMKSPFICIAGVDLATGDHVRPVLRGGQQLRSDLLVRNDGPFEMAARVELGKVKAVGAAPETEDHLFEPTAAKLVGYLSPKTFWSLLESKTKATLTEIFGPDLKKLGAQAAAVDVGHGRVSLGCLVPTGKPRLYTQPRSGKPDQVRLIVRDAEMNLDLGVTDIRLYGADHVTPDVEAIKGIAKRLVSGERVILSVGLTRASASSPRFNPVHWLQVNNIHLESDPGWKLG